MSLMNASSVLLEIDALERKRAERLYALAIINVHSGYQRVAKGYAEECILLLRKIGDDTYEECATRTACVENIPMPEFLHEDVVRQNMAFYKITLEA